MTYPTTADEYLEFEGMDVFGFIMTTFPTIDAIIAARDEDSALVYADLDVNGQITSKFIVNPYSSMPYAYDVS